MRWKNEWRREKKKKWGENKLIEIPEDIQEALSLIYEWTETDARNAFIAVYKMLSSMENVLKETIASEQSLDRVDLDNFMEYIKKYTEWYKDECNG